MWVKSLVVKSNVGTYWCTSSDITIKCSTVKVVFLIFKINSSEDALVFKDNTVKGIGITNGYLCCPLDTDSPAGEVFVVIDIAFFGSNCTVFKEVVKALA